MKKVFISGCFNVVHPGHLRILRFGKEAGQFLTVGVSSDRVSQGGSFVKEELRLENVRSIAWVDESFIYDEPIDELILRIKPDIVIKGSEFEGLYNPELGAVNKYGGRLLFGSGEAMFSSADLISQELNSVKNKLNLHKNFLTTHSISLNRLIDVVENFKNLKVLTIGDLIIDQYINCNAVGMSQEEPTLVVTPVDDAQFIGGAGIVAGHAASMSSKSYFLTLVGKDTESSFALSKLEANFVNAEAFIDETRPTSLKTRFRAGGKSLLRVNRLHTHDISSELELKLLESLERIITDADLVILSDFNYGCLPKKIVLKIMNIINKHHNKFISADSQSSSQIGDLRKFQNVDLITATEYEARLTVGDSQIGLVVLSKRLQELCNAKNILLKLGPDGLMIADPNSEFTFTDILPAFNSSPIDVSGAGDSMLVASSMALCCGATIWEAGYLGSLAAGIQVSRLGNIPISSAELISALKG